MPLFRGQMFFSFSDLQTTSKHWVQWSLHLPYPLNGDEVGVYLFGSVSTQSHLAHAFLSLLRLTWWESTKRDLESDGRRCEVMFRSVHSLFACEFVQFIFLYVWVKIVIYCIFVCFMFYVCFALSSLLLLFACTVAAEVSHSFVRIFPHNCYYYYYIVTIIVSLFYYIFIWQLQRHVVHYESFSVSKFFSCKPIYIYILYTRNMYIYKCMYHDCKVWMFADLNGIFLSNEEKMGKCWG